MTAQETECRKAFEEWVVTAWEPEPCLDYADKGYVDCWVQHQWEGWQRYHNTIGKELADALELCVPILHGRKDAQSKADYSVVRGALAKYRGTR